MTTLYIDLSRNALVVSPVNTARCLAPGLTVGDTVPLTLAFLLRNPQPLNTGTPIYLYQDFSAQGVTFNLGTIQSPPTDGTFTLTWGGDTTAQLPFNLSAYDLSVALNALPGVIVAGGVTISGNVNGPFKIRFITNGARATITSVANALFPPSIVTIAPSQTGTATNPSCQVLSFNQNPIVALNAWTPQAAAAVTVTSLSTTVIQRVSIPAGTYGGSFTLTYNGATSIAIPFNAQLDLVASALNALAGITGATVVPGQNYWDITIPGGTHALTGTATGLIIPLTLTGSLVLTAQNAEDLLAGQQSAAIPFNIQTTAGGSIQTLYSGAITLSLP